MFITPSDQLNETRVRQSKRSCIQFYDIAGQRSRVNASINRIVSHLTALDLRRRAYTVSIRKEIASYGKSAGYLQSGIARKILLSTCLRSRNDEHPPRA